MEQFSGEWPLTVDSGTLQCFGNAVMFTDTNGTKYTVNTLAYYRSIPSQVDEYLIHGIQEITAKDKKLTDFIAQGLAICKEDGT